MDFNSCDYAIRFWNSIEHLFTEKQRRIALAHLASFFGRGGLTIVHEATGISYDSLKLGCEEISFITEASKSEDALTWEVKTELERLTNPLKYKMPS